MSVNVVGMKLEAKPLKEDFLDEDLTTQSQVDVKATRNGPLSDYDNCLCVRP